MRGLDRKVIVALLTVSLLCTLTGCFGKKPKKPDATGTPNTSQEPSSEEASHKEAVKAQGDGNKKSDVPFVIGCEPLEKQFNPFLCKTQQDKFAVDFTQLRLLTFDREGALVNHAIEGEDRQYNGETYHYQGPANVRVKYRKQEKRTEYTIRLRRDIVFSDGEELNIDDVIFSLYAFADKSYQGVESTKQLKIVDVERINNYKCIIRVEGFDRDDLQALNIPICPLHIYGDEGAYRYEEGRFGFQKGDISSLIKKKNTPMGAGPYKFIKYENGIVYYEADEKYYLECPLTAFIQLKEVDTKDIVKRAEMLAEAELDMVTLSGENDSITEITSINSNGKLNGGTISTRLYDGAQYSYFGMNAQTVCVDGKPDSTRSKNLRRALGILIGCNRESAVKIGEQSAKVIQYPASDTSWSVPQSANEEYMAAYGVDVDGNAIYNSHMNIEERSAAACKAALGYLKQAGFQVKRGQITSAPEETKRRFRLLLSENVKENEAVESLLANAGPMFEKIGIRLDVVKNVSEKHFNRALKKGNVQMWFGFSETKPNGDLYEMFHSSDGKSDAGRRNYFQIRDSDLDEYIEETLHVTGMKKSVELYGKCYEKVMEWAVVVPFYQERDISIFSSSRINMDTITPDITTYYGWWDEIHSVEMK